MIRTSRRSVLAVLVTFITGGLAGCSNEESGDGGIARTSTVESESNSSVLRSSVVRKEGKVLLEVYLEKPEVEETNIKTVKVFNSEGRLEHEIPVNKDISGERPGNENFAMYYHTLGIPPRHGHLRVEAHAEDGTVVDFREFTYACNSNPFD